MPELSYPQSGAAPGKGRHLSLIVFLVVIAIGAAYCAVHLATDLEPVREASFLPYLLLGVALLIALGFEFVNGFHDTANAVATVIYTHSLAPNIAVVWSGGWNFLGVLTSSGAVAFGDPAVAARRTDSAGGQQRGLRDGVRAADRGDHLESGHVVFRTAVVESHTLIGSIIGVGLMNQMMHGANGTSGVDWNQALGVGKSLLFSPLVGFFARRFAAADPEGSRAGSGAVCRAERQGTAAVLDSRPADSDLHGRFVRARFERRAKGHGPHHADPDRYGANGVRAEQGSHTGGNADLLAVAHQASATFAKYTARRGAVRRSACAMSKRMCARAS